MEKKRHQRGGSEGKDLNGDDSLGTWLNLNFGRPPWPSKSRGKGLDGNFKCPVSVYLAKFMIFILKASYTVYI